MAGTINIKDLLSSDPTLQEFLVKADENGLTTKTSVQKIANLLETVGEVGFKGSLLISETPTEDGFYFAGESGTYTNAGGLVIDISNQLVVIIVSGTQTVFSKIDMPLGYTVATSGTPLQGSDDLFTGNEVFKNVRSEITDEIASEQNILKNFGLTDGFRTSDSGNIIPDAAYFHSEPIEVIVGDRYSSVSNDIGVGIRYAFYSSSVISSDGFISPIISARNAIVPSGATHMVLAGLLTLKDSFIVLKLASGFPTLGQNTFIYQDLYIRSEVDSLVTKEAIINKIDSAIGDERIDVSSIKGLDGITPTNIGFNIYENNKFKKPLTLVQGDNIESNITPSNPVGTTAFVSYEYVDATSFFPYTGNAFKGVGDVSFGYFGISIPQRELIKDSGYLNSETLNVNIEFFSPKNSTVTIQIYANNGTVTQLGTNIPKTVTTGYNVMQFNISGYTYDPDLLHFEIRFFDFGFNIFRSQTFYFGRINVFSGASSNLLEFDNGSDFSESVLKLAKQSLSIYNDNKSSCLGDSLTFQRYWQNEALSPLGISFDSDEIVFGLNGFSPTGVGGSTIVPFVQGGAGTGSGQSIYVRASDIVNYNPKIIFIFGGQNDNPSLGATATAPQTSILGTIDDVAYTGLETSVLADVPSFYASLKGIVEKLITDLPNSYIVFITPAQNENTSISTSTFNTQKAKVDAIIEVAELYSFPVVDLFRKGAINSINFSSKLKDTVHFNYQGGIDVAKSIINVIG